MTADWLMKLGTGARGPGGRTRLRLLALPHAGGWPSAFRTWRRVLPPDVELLVAQLPGRGTRMDEPPLRRVEPLVEGLTRAVAALEPLPYVILGHSFGSVLGYELAKALERKGLPPRLLAVSARQPPCFPSEAPFAHRRTDAELLDHLVEMGGISPELISRTDLVRGALTAIRADLEAMETYRRPLSGTAVPILSLGAVDDPVVIAERLHLWSLETTGPFDRLMFTGGHFYLYAPGVATSVARRLLTDTGGVRTGDNSRPYDRSPFHRKDML
ncbi:thioesterase II family protein [Streptomyces liangshanensis]|uniref:Thioesterase n=1 Tax=Streptomyces liangshanensis TaxID=2717324 RepID=A0A6G9H4R5_9ACTN|nr:alpha/beta fold hydrolase [Streptomyces liangshanensis]QIQ05515.1 thioesterase [Streptomyces liangshanensis]